MKVAAIQMTSGPEVAANLEQARVLLDEAAARGVRLAVLPENFAFMGLKDADKRAVAEADGTGPAQDFLAATARRLRLWIVGGTLPLRAGEDGRVAAASLVYDSDGVRVARYDKIHLFDVDIPGRAESYRESAHVAPGSRAALIDTPLGRCPRPLPAPPGGRTGRHCCAPAPSRISVMLWRRRSPASTRAAARPTATA